MNWYVEVLKKYAVFEGRTRRQEYWMFWLINLIISLVLNFVAPDFFGYLYGLAILIPFLAVTVRRLHDTGRSGWWLLIGLIAVLGTLVLLIFLILDSTPGPNEFGVNPKEDTPGRMDV